MNVFVKVVVVYKLIRLGFESILYKKLKYMIDYYWGFYDNIFWDL